MMTLETYQEYLRSLDDKSLLVLRARGDDELKEYQNQQGRIDQELCRRLEERHATVIVSTDWEFELPKRYDYPPGCFRPLLEVIPQEDLIREKAYRPEETRWEPTVTIPGHYENIEESWDTRKVLELAKKRGKEALSIIERNRVPKHVTPQFRKVEKVEHDHTST